MEPETETETIKAEFRNRLGFPIDLAARGSGGERIYVITVPREHAQAASDIALTLEQELKNDSFQVFMTVRAAPDNVAPPAGPVRDLRDSRIDALIQLLSSRSRVSEKQPSLSYIPRNTASLAATFGPRHTLVFGRRGAGKTALLVESRKAVSNDSTTVWINAQPLGPLGLNRTFIRIVIDIIDSLKDASRLRRLNSSEFFRDLELVHQALAELYIAPEPKFSQINTLLPDVQRAIRRATNSMDNMLFVFIDDFHYVPRHYQADLLNLLHSCTRDANTWLKIASIKHLTHWYRPNPPTGLQTDHDVILVELDLSLQNPRETVGFLNDMFTSYCQYAGIATISNIINRPAVDRLAFASGGVPRDFLVLASSSIGKARGRSGRTVGITDVNQAAGDIAKIRIDELETDLGSNIGASRQTTNAFYRLRAFCVDEKNYTYFRIDFRDKDENTSEYDVLTRLLETRLIHLVDPAVSDIEVAGEKSECYTLDLSQYSGYRLKQNLRVLDFQEGQLAAKRTRPRTNSESAQGAPLVVAESSRQVLQILRVAPVFKLSRFEDLVKAQDPVIDEVNKLIDSQHSTVSIGELVVNLGRPFGEVSAAIEELLKQGKVLAVDADGVTAYKRLR
ncbi:hypothetical protein BKA01_007835 [Pseudonocardia eucalypti]|uniref:ORC-CDC6 family AAA ATPase n=1 Tax=Pseudonocardia eucalypti TaxID=648755 RepID=UPI0016210339|nr:hypothetical protein [Pseudonocardia eucalypti]